MKQEQYKKLKEYEQQLTTALYCDYARNVTSKGFEVLNGVYKELFNKDSGLGSGCGKCQLKALKEIAKEYFAYKEKQEEKMAKAREGKNKEENNTIVEEENNNTIVEEDNENGEEGES